MVGLERMSDLVDEIKERLAPVFEKMKGRICAVYLFGSHAKGDATPKSDIDLALLLPSGDPHEAMETRLDFYADANRALQRNDIDILIINRTRNLFILDSIACNGIVLYDGDKSARENFEIKSHHDFIDFRDQRRQVTGM